MAKGYTDDPQDLVKDGTFQAVVYVRGNPRVVISQIGSVCCESRTVRFDRGGKDRGITLFPQGEVELHWASEEVLHVVMKYRDQDEALAVQPQETGSIGVVARDYEPREH